MLAVVGVNAAVVEGLSAMVAAGSVSFEVARRGGVRKARERLGRDVVWMARFFADLHASKDPAFRCEHPEATS